jgi:hypothetical protein
MAYSAGASAPPKARTDLDGAERRLLGELAHDAEIAYAQIESETLQKRVSVLEHQLAQVSEHR